MKPIDILAALPKWATAKASDILASPAWAMPCRLGERQCVMRLDAAHPAETLDLSVKLEGEDHILGIPDSPAFPELHVIWPSRGDVPEPILLALVEKDCGQLLQLIENAARRQLKIAGLAPASAVAEDCDPPAPASADQEHDTPDSGAKTAFAQIYADGEPLFSFTLTLSDALETAFGQLRNLDTGNPVIRDTPLAAEAEYATFPISAADFASLTTGDALLLPEIGTQPPRLIVEGRLAIAENGVTEWKDNSLPRVCATESLPVTVGTVLDAAEHAPEGLLVQPKENAPLNLVRSGKTVAQGRLDRVGAQFAFIVE